MTLKKTTNHKIFIYGFSGIYKTSTFLNRLITNTTIYWNPRDLSTHGRIETKQSLLVTLNYLARIICNIKLNLERQNYVHMS